ncbi:hypothetical protein KO500_08665 [Cellulophaga baltica]|uniref:hypothetical protein n=1 Tax=Cellulophaga TaxID=104264 RepID=UPI001C079941|nr:MULTISPECIES: hypothetical protein [Cellulophaga]MBU2996505.1 hypothetical protein [Cellulophaga baltica]MDO6767899.1 hypothetical protein [Cellulophaga sp. 1_MG-2023]
MKSKLSLICLVLFSYSCTNNIDEKDLPLLNGYWEIQKVTFPNGQTKDYTVNESIDYIEIEQLKGFRKKVKPNFNGSYITNDDAEFFTVFKKENQIFLNYKNDLSDWTESLKTLTKDQFSVTNEDDITYLYKRYEPINISK